MLQCVAAFARTFSSSLDLIRHAHLGFKEMHQGWSLFLILELVSAYAILGQGSQVRYATLRILQTTRGGLLI